MVNSILIESGRFELKKTIYGLSVDHLDPLKKKEGPRGWGPSLRTKAVSGGVGRFEAECVTWFSVVKPPWRRFHRVSAMPDSVERHPVSLTHR